MTRAIRVYEHGGPEVLRLESVADSAPGPGEAVVRHRAVGLNFIDTYHRTGLYPLPRPHGLGMEAAGVVEAVGEGVTQIVPGDRVAYVHGPPGAYAERRVHHAEHLVPLPDDIDDDTAAAALLKGMTVEYLIRRAFRVEPGMTVLLHAAAGGIGLIACQWLAHLGVTVIGTVGSRRKAELARAHGCTHPVVRGERDFVARVRELTGGQGVPVVYDSVGRATAHRSLECLRPRGLLVGFGSASGPPEPFDMSVLAQKGSLYVTRPALFDYVVSRDELLASARAVFDVVRRGVVRVEIHQRFALARAADAHRALESRATTGSTILVP